MNRLSRRAVPAGAALLAAITVLLLIPSSALAFPPERWYRLIDSGHGNDVGYGVAIDSDGNVIAVGYAASTADRGRNGHVVKYSPSGTVLCDFEVDSGPVGGTGGVASDDRLLGVAVDSEDNFVVVGTLSGTYPPAAQAAFIHKYDAGCSPVWDHPIVYTDRPNDSAWNSAYDVAIDGEDHIYVGGGVFGGWGSPEGEWAIWKYDPDGNLAAGFPIRYNYLNYSFIQDVAQGIALDREGNIIGSGYRGVSGYDGSLTNDVDWHVRKYDASGGLVWEHTHDGPTHRADYAWRVATDSERNVVVAGYFNKGTDNSTNANYDWLVIKYSPEGVGGVGQPLWSKAYESQAGMLEGSYGVAVDDNDDVLVAGYERDPSNAVSGRIARLAASNGAERDERIIDTPPGVVPLKAVRRGTDLALAGYVITGPPGNQQNDIYVALATVDAIALTSPVNHETFTPCSYYAPPTFAWNTHETLKKVELQFTRHGSSSQTVKVPAPAGAGKVAVPKAIWKKILLKPGASGGAVDWKAVGTKQDNGKVESDVLTFEVAGPEPAGNPSIGPTSKSGTPTLRWENNCNSKFKVWFGSTAGFAKRKSFTFVVPNPASGNGTFSKALTAGQWNAVRKLAGDADGAAVYWYVESWDAMKRSGKTGTMSFQLSP